ncbi:MAG: hypothetical protein WD431_19740 [Cyclobacteriaceae bacterium]
MKSSLHEAGMAKSEQGGMIIKHLPAGVRFPVYRKAGHPAFGTEQVMTSENQNINRRMLKGCKH